MIEPKGEMKFKKLDAITLEACDENGCKVWTLDTIAHSIIQIDKEVDKLTATREFYQNLQDTAVKLGIITPKEADDIKKEEEIKKTKKTNK